MTGKDVPASWPICSKCKGTGELVEDIDGFGHFQHDQCPACVFGRTPTLEQYEIWTERDPR